MLKHLLKVFPYVIIMTFANVIITMVISFNLMSYMIFSGYDKYLSFGLSIVMATIVYCYLSFNYKIRNYINDTRREINE